MIKYYHFARMAFGDYANNRLRMLTRFIVYMLLAWMMVTMWEVVYDTGHGPQGISLLDMGWYNGIVQMMFFLSPRLFVVIDEDVRSGNIGYFLNRPMPYLWMRLAEGIGGLAFHILVFFLAGTVFLTLFMGGLPSGGMGILLQSLCLLIGGSIIHLLFQIFCGLSTFWTNDAIFIYHTYQKTVLLLGGIYIPIHLYPAMMHPEILKLLPFAAMVGGPSSVLIGQGGFAEILGLQLFWITFILLALKSFYAVCLRKVEVNGG